MASGRKSIYSSAALIRLLEAVPEASASGRISLAADAYMTIMDHEIAAIRWTKDEWAAVMDAVSGCPDWHLMWAAVAKYHGLEERCSVDIAAISAEIRSMSITSKIAVYEAATRFWAYGGAVDEAMAYAGIKPIAEQGRPF